VSLRDVLLVLVGASVGLSLGAMAMHIVALIRTRDLRGQVGFIFSKLGWALVMLPILKALSAQSHVEATGLTYWFSAGVAIASVGYAFVAVDVNRANRILVASAAHKVGLGAVENTLAQVGNNRETDITEEDVMAERSKLYLDKAGKYRWHRISANGDTVGAATEGYDHKQGAVDNYAETQGPDAPELEDTTKETP
jgi:uncharacterized protein YegP (UPF0339 family)